MPSQVMDFLGITVDTVLMQLKLPGEKIKKIRAEARRMEREASVSARSLSRLIGKMNATSQVIPPAPLFFRHLQMTLTQTLERGSQDYDVSTSLSQQCKEELRWWDNHMRRWNGKSLIIDLTIESDASLIGWGAVSRGQRTGGPWTEEEAQMHINCLELLAATFATQTFAKEITDTTILLKIDNTTAVAYINNLGGTISQDLVVLAKDLWMWCLERNIHIIAQHLPGVLNQTADAESRLMRDRMDWKLNPCLYRRIDQLLGPIEVDLFASRITKQCPVYYSWLPDPYAAATDAFLQDWSLNKGFANPPWCLIGRVLSQVQMQQAQVILLAPVWKTQPWYPLLLGMLVDYPRWVHNNQVVVTNQVEQVTPPQLAVWPISGRNTEVKSFQRKLRHYSLKRGGPRPISLTTHSSTSGVAGVTEGVQIPFVDL